MKKKNKANGFPESNLLCFPKFLVKILNIVENLKYDSP